MSADLIRSMVGKGCLLASPLFPYQLTWCLALSRPCEAQGKADTDSCSKSFLLLVLLSPPPRQDDFLAFFLRDVLVSVQQTLPRPKLVWSI